MALLRFTSSITLALAQIVSAPSSSTPAGVPSASVATPASPEERMALAQKVNGLHGLKQAWHLKATYEWFDPDGLTREKGAYEEWRVDEEHYRIAIHGPLTSTEEYGDERGIFRSRANVWLRSPLSRIHSLVVAPLQLPPGLGHRVVKNHERDFGAGKKPCTLIVDERVSYGQPGGIDYCFTPENAVLFYKGDDKQLFPALFEHFMPVQGHSVAQDTQLFAGGSLWLKIHIDQVLSLTSADISAMHPPVGTQRAALSMETGLGETPVSGRILAHKIPDYSAPVKAHGIQGMVTLSCLVDKTGKPQEIAILAGPPALREPALDAVRQWVWSPFRLKGETVAWETIVVLSFHLTG